MPFPFEAPFSDVAKDLDSYVQEVFSALKSDFIVLPRGPGFVDYPVFEKGYEALKRTMAGFRKLVPDEVVETVLETPITLIVLRSILGFSPPEWAYLASQDGGIEVGQAAARTIDRRIRLQPEKPLNRDGRLTEQRVRALVRTACRLLTERFPEVESGFIHRLDKADTKAGLDTIRVAADIGLPYPVLLYERFLGRPFSGHRDSVSELVGDVLESAIEEVLHRAGVSFRKTKRAERVPGFEQAPDFIIPTEQNPAVVIEAKITEDDGTARDKVSRISMLCQHAKLGSDPEHPKYEVVACIAGRGFRERREDMKKLLIATQGKVFTLQNVSRLTDCTRIRDFVTRKS